MKNTLIKNLPILLAGIVAALAVVVWNQSNVETSIPNAAEVGFAQDMSVHHQQAVDMSFIIRENTENQEIRNFAFDIINTQATQRGSMLGWLEQWGEPLTTTKDPMMWMMDDMKSDDGKKMMNHFTEGAYMPGMATSEEMEQLANSFGEDAERLFLELMIRHHQSGVMMAEGVVDRSDTEYIVRLAQTMVDGQRSEIEYMSSLLDTAGANGATDEARSGSGPNIGNTPVEVPPNDGLGSDRDLPMPLPPESDIFCTMDAKVCPDGSSVGRVAPSCEFAACPGGSNNQSGNTINTEPDILPNNTQSEENTVLKITPTIPKENDSFSFFSNGDGKIPVYLSGDTLKVSVNYGGGCVEHDFTLLWDGAFLESYPVQVGLNLVHDDNEDMCDALLYETLEFDLTPLKNAYINGYNTNTGEIVLQIAGSENNGESILYKFN